MRRRELEGGEKRYSDKNRREMDDENRRPGSKHKTGSNYIRG